MTNTALSTYDGISEQAELPINGAQDGDLTDILNKQEERDRIISLLVGKLVSLPKEDTIFLDRDIPEELWNSLAMTLR